MRLTTWIVLATAFCASVGLAEAKPRHVVVLAFDGPRTLAETGRTAVILALSEYDLVATPRWQEAQTQAHDAAGAQGAEVWSKAAKQTGVDAVIDGWVQDKQLTVIVHDATDGTALEQLTVKVGRDGLSTDASRLLRAGLEERLAALTLFPESLKPQYEPVPRLGKVTVEPTQTPAPPPAIEVAAAAPTPAPAPAPAVTTTATTTTVPATVPATGPAAPAPGAAPVTVAAAEPKCVDVFGDCPAVAETPQAPPKQVPLGTPRFRFELGGDLRTRTLHFQADLIEDITQYDGVASKALAVYGEIYPFPLTHGDGQPSGPGASLALYHSVGSTVGIDDEETTGDYNINENGFLAALHWRQPLGPLVHLDGEIGYSQDTYIIEDPPEDYEVPDTAYSALHVGAHCDLTVGGRATLGFGARWYHILDQGDLTSIDFYGPGKSSAFSLDANFVVPLPKNVYVRGRLGYKRIHTTFDGVGDITEEEDVWDGSDSTVEGGAAVGIAF